MKTLQEAAKLAISESSVRDRISEEQAIEKEIMELEVRATVPGLKDGVVLSFLDAGSDTLVKASSTNRGILGIKLTSYRRSESLLQVKKVFDEAFDELIKKTKTLEAKLPKN